MGNGNVIRSLELCVLIRFGVLHLCPSIIDAAVYRGLELRLYKDFLNVGCDVLKE